MYIDIHTHHPKEASLNYFALPNLIVSKDYLTYQACSAGIHPWYIDEDLEKQVDTLKRYVSKPSVWAVGECGLDKLHSSPWERQLLAFERQIELAIEVQKPLIIHCVRAYSELMVCLMKQRTNVPVILHGYAKNWDLAKTLLQKGYYLSLGASILKGQQNELIEQLPLDQLFLETDDKAVSISEIYAYFCHARKLTKEQLQAQIEQNFNRVFKK